MKKPNEYINILGITIIIMLIGIYENMHENSGLLRLIVSIIVLVIGLSIVIRNLIIRGR